jgi:hypothetical protein
MCGGDYGGCSYNTIFYYIYYSYIPYSGSAVTLLTLYFYNN